MSQHGKRPNLVFVFADEFRQQSLGFMKQDPAITPNLDRLATESLVLTHAISNCPICSPYRAMLFTGKYPASNGVIANCYSDTISFGIELKDSERCLPDILHHCGYSQGYIGKLHLHLPKAEHIPYTEGWRGKPGEGTFWDAYTPPGPGRHGIDFWHSYGCCDQHLTPHYWTGDAPVNERIDVNEWSVKHETDVAIRYLRNTDGTLRDNDKPFALFVSYNPPHMPFDQVPSEYVEKYRDKTPDELLNRPNVVRDDPGHPAFASVKNYFAAITGVDEQFGRIVAALDQENLSEDTIVVFTSDHGDMMGSHGLMGKLVGYDESLLVPFLIRWPNTIKIGSDNLLFSAPDILPTLLGLMGLQDEVAAEVEGRDYSSVFLGQACERPFSAYYCCFQPQFDDYPRRRGIRTNRHTFIVDRLGPTTRLTLFDNDVDPYQMNNIAGSHAKIVREMTMELNRWLVETKDSSFAELA
jgi:arylsulfatase A-like enzyme